MDEFDTSYDEFDDEELRLQVAHERRVIRISQACQCDESIGTCPGVRNCAYSDLEEDDEDF